MWRILQQESIDDFIIATGETCTLRDVMDAAFASVGLDVNAVVAAAIVLLDEQGLHGFTIRALSARLGVKAPTIYWHVGSKDQLLESVIEQEQINPGRLQPLALQISIAPDSKLHSFP